MPIDGIGDVRESPLATSGVALVVVASDICDAAGVEHGPDACGPFGCAGKAVIDSVLRTGAREGADREERVEVEIGREVVGTIAPGACVEMLEPMCARSTWRERG